MDLEKSRIEAISERPWLTDTCVADWFYDATMVFRKPGHVIEDLVDIVSKNGAMLLNILQRPDGSIDDETAYLLSELADWYSICGEGIYGTRPYNVHGEGETIAQTENFKEERANWSCSDVRYTRKDRNIYAFMMKQSPCNVVILQKLNEIQVEKVVLLGCGEVEFAQNFGVLNVQLPDRLPTKHVNCLKIKY